jgi:hypothetical protein
MHISNAYSVPDTKREETELSKHTYVRSSKNVGVEILSQFCLHLTSHAYGQGYALQVAVLAEESSLCSSRTLPVLLSVLQSRSFGDYKLHLRSSIA